MGFGTKEVICKRCGNTVCETCSNNKRQIARLDPVAYTVCDMCDTQLDNVLLRYSMHTQQKLLEKKAKIL